MVSWKALRVTVLYNKIYKKYGLHQKEKAILEFDRSQLSQTRVLQGF